MKYTVLSAKIACLTLMILALGLLLTFSSAPLEAQSAQKPNIVLILTDDLDAGPMPLSRMPSVRRYLVNQGTTFENAFVTNPMCCPSRATILRGQYSHNHKVLSNGPPLGGFKRFRPREKSTVATWLQSGGYRTVLVGKYLNGKPRGHKPPGWDEIYAGGYSADGVYHTDWYASKASGFIKRMKGERRPFFVYLATKAPHSPAEPAPRHADAFPGAKAPRTPAFNEQDISDKPQWVRKQELLTASETKYIDDLHRKRMQSMLAVDQMVKRLVKSLRSSGKLNNTYIFFTSDNGWAKGEHRRRTGKGSAYEEDIRVPLLVRGPGVSEGTVRKHIVLNNDFAPTFAQLGKVRTPAFVDGRSLAPLWRSYSPPPANWRSAFLIEGYKSNRSDRPPYKAVRTDDSLWTEYTSGERELYDLSRDPHQLQSLHATAPDSVKQHLARRLDRLRDCKAQGCRNAEGF